MSFTNTGGGDHEGVDWTPADTTIIGGVHYNIGTFLCTTGYTLHLEDDNELEIYANIITVTGDIDGNGHSTSSSGNGGAGGNNSSGAGGGGGGGYGAAGGAGGAGAFGAAGSAGSQFGTSDTTIISLGSKGGVGGLNSSSRGLGGNGGGSVYLSGNTITVTGTVSLNGNNGTSAAQGGGGGGGSGGGLLIVGGAVAFSGTYSGTGGNGANGGADNDGGGGGGAGGRCKIIYRTINIAGGTFTLTAGTAGTGTGTGSNGSNGNAGNHTDTEVKCNSTYAMGQTFTPETTIAGKFYISEIRLWAMAVTVSGKVFTMTVYDDSGKGSTYGTATLTISATGEKVFEFEPWIELPDATSQYYLEVTTPDGDVDFGTEGNEPLSGEDLYFKVILVEQFAMYIRVFGLIPVGSPQIYNTADTTIKCNIANEMLIGAVHRINVDGTGTVDYNDDFTTAKWAIDSTNLNASHDTTNDELDIADDGYIYWKKDTNFPIDGIPTLTARINITSGTPTIQISDNAATWYDIDTAIADDVETVYPLDSDGNLSLAGKTIFYWRFDCVKAAAATCSIKSFELDINIHTIYAKNPVITKGATASTFRIDQDAASGMVCEVALFYPDRWWA